MHKIMSFILTVVIFIGFQGCNNCTRSGKRNIQNNANIPLEKKAEQENDQSATVIKMEKINGVYQIPVDINGVSMYFIFDTGAGLISISATEASFLFKQGKLTRDDVIGKANFIDANGDISEGTIINLQTVQIGDKELKDIRASVVHNLKAPLLFGQSALEKFGKISIDYKKAEITFE